MYLTTLYHYILEHLSQLHNLIQWELKLRWARTFYTPSWPLLGVLPAFFPSRRDDTTKAIKGPQSEGVYWPPSSAKIKNVWNVTSTPIIWPYGTLCSETRNYFTNCYIKFKYTVWILNCYSQSNTEWQCGFANVRLHLTDLKGLSSHTMPCHWQICTFTTCHRQCFQHIPTHGTRCLPSHQHPLQTRWDLITCILIDGYQCFRATLCFHSSTALKMVATNYS